MTRKLLVKNIVFLFTTLHLFLTLSNTALAAASDDSILRFLPAILNRQTVTVTFGDLSISYPTGTFIDKEQIALKEISPAVDPSDYFGTPDGPVYNLQVASKYVCSPLTVQISNFGGTDRNVLVALRDSVSGDAVIPNTTYPEIIVGIVSNGILSFKIPATEECEESISTLGSSQPGITSLAISQTDIGSGFNFWAISGYNTLASNHFRVNYPTAILSEGGDRPEIILQAAELAYTLLEGLGFTFNTKLNWPLDINVTYGMTNYGETAIPLSGKKNQYININADLCLTQETDSLKSTTGHEFFHVVQNVYNPRSGLLIRHSWATPYFFWLSEASSIWFENIILNSGSWTPEPFTVNYPLMSQGFETYINDANPHTAASSRGYWASGYLRYLIDRANRNEFVFDLWEQVRNQKNTYSDLKALIDAQGSSVESEITWASFITKFASGNTDYPDWPLPAFNASFFDYNHEVLDFSANLEPFSAVKWGMQFKRQSGYTGDYQIMVTSMPNSNLNFDLYLGKNINGPFTQIATLKNNQGYPFNPAAGDIFSIIVSNADSDAPYQTPVTASVRVARSDKSRYCPSVPDYAMMVQDTANNNLLWKHPTLGYYFAIEHYSDNTLSQISSVDCRNIDTGQCWFRKGWNVVAEYENPSTAGDWYFWNYEPLNSNCQLDGTYLRYWWDGSLHDRTDFNLGKTHGTHESYYAPQQGGHLFDKGQYENDAKVGTWYYYKMSGDLNHTCTWDGSYYPVECHCADIDNCDPMNY